MDEHGVNRIILFALKSQIDIGHQIVQTSIGIDQIGQVFQTVRADSNFYLNMEKSLLRTKIMSRHNNGTHRIAGNKTTIDIFKKEC